MTMWVSSFGNNGSTRKHSLLGAARLRAQENKQ